jgi:hypothetical protein
MLSLLCRLKLDWLKLSPPLAEFVLENVPVDVFVNGEYGLDIS